MVAVGVALAVTEILAVAVHPDALVTVTVYIPVVVAFIDWVVLLSAPFV
jgi:hypothetical protein